MTIHLADVRPRPGDIIGYGKRGPIRLQAGGAPRNVDVGGGELDDDDADDAGNIDGDADDQADDADAADEDEPEWTPPTKEQWEAQQAKLKRANSQAKRLREAKDGKAKPTEADDAGKADAELERWQSRAIRSDAKAGLVSRGVDPDMVELALAKLKPAEIEFDDDDDPVLDDWLDDMEERFPKLFQKAVTPEPRRTARRAGTVDQGAGAGGRAQQRPPQSMTQQLYAAAEASTRRR